MRDITEENHPENQPEKEREPVIDLGYRPGEIGAFPCSPFSVPGMSLRDYMAAHAPLKPGFLVEATLSDMAQAAISCYKWADAMLEARKMK